VKRALVVARTYPAFFADLSSFGWKCVHVAPAFGWVQGVLPRERTEVSRADVIVSSSSDSAVHIMAYRIKNGLPWVADLQRPDDPRLQTVLTKASAITAASRPFVRRMQRTCSNVQVRYIPEPFDAEDWTEVDFVHPDAATFLSLAELVRGLQDPRPLLIAIRDLLRDRCIATHEIRLVFYANHPEWLRSEIARIGIAAIAKVQKRPPRREVLFAARAATRLLCFVGAQAVSDPPEVPEYLGARRLILAVGGEAREPIDETLRESGAGERVCCIAAVRDATMQAIEEWRRHETPTVDADRVLCFERRSVARSFSDLLDLMVQRALVANTR
jgi:hypothetical protein